MKKLIGLIALIFFMNIAGINAFAGISVNKDTAKTETVDDFESADDFEEVDDFEEAGSEFEEVSEEEELPQTIEEVKTETGTPDYVYDITLEWSLYALAFAVVAGFLVRFRQTRSLRGLILLGSLFLFGFYRGGCPCMLSSFQDTVLIIMGNDVAWQNLVWFLGLIPITYVFGKVWCGWVCHLGAVQEFLYLPARFKIFQGETAMKTMKIIRYALLAALIIQLGVMGSIYFCSIDPFKAIFNMHIEDEYLTITGVLLGLILLTSLFSYRPFCKSACPVGLVLGFVSKIPGASVIGLKGECAGCKVCSNACNYDAIIRKDKYSILNNNDCIACGDCMDACNRSGLGFFRKTKKHTDIVYCKNECTIN